MWTYFNFSKFVLLSVKSCVRWQLLKYLSAHLLCTAGACMLQRQWICYCCLWTKVWITNMLICGNKTPTRCNRWYLLQMLLLAQHLSGIMVPKTCWASNKICNKYHLLLLVGILFPYMKCVFWFSLQILSETFLILRRNERDMIKNVYWCSCKVTFILVRF